MTVNTQKPIVIFRGDNTSAFDLRTIKILLTGDLDLTNATARFDLLDFTKSWTTEEVATGELSIVFDSAQTKSFSLGPQVGTLRLFDMSTGTPRQLTIVNKIPFFVTNRVCEIDSQSYKADVCVSGGDVIHIEFKVGAGAVEGKADKVKNATAGDLASLTADGNLEDSGIPKTDVLRKSQMDSTPTAGSQNPVTSDGIKQAIDAATPSDYAQVKAQVEANTTDISTINGKIPAQASAQNQLADKAFVNSSIATNTATFRGSYNLVSDLGLTVSATEQQVAAAIATKLASLVPPVVPENNDYCFVQVPKTDAEPTVIERVDRYKCTVTESGGVTTRVWEYEWSLNNSSFTADQWAAINSGITSGLVDKLINLPSAEELLGKGYLVFQPSRNGFDGVSGDTAAIQRNASSLWGYNPSADSNYSVGFLIDPVAYSGAAIKNGSYYVSADPLANYITSYRQVLLSSLTIDLYVSDNGVSDIRLSVKDASGANTLFSSDWIDEITTGTAARFEFSFPGNDVWLDGGTQYRFIIEGRDAFGDEMSASVRLLRNQIYTYAQNKGVKWSSILANGTTVETQDYALEMTMGVTATITAQIPLANLMDVGFMGFSELTEYHTGDRCVYNGNLYECTSSGNNHKGPWVANHFKLVMSLSENITMGGALPFSAHGNPTSNIILGFNAASAAGSQNIVLGYSATAHRTNTGTYSDTTSGNVVIGAAATVDNNESPDFAPNDNVVIGKYSKSHGSYDVVLGVNSEVTGDSGLAIGNNAKVTHAGAIAIGNNAVSNGAGTATLAITALNKFFLGSDNIVDLINAAVNTAIQNQTIAAAVSTTTVTGGGRRLLAAATPTSSTKTEVTAADIGALGNTGDQTLNGTLTLGHTRIEEDKIVYNVGAAGESNLKFPAGVSDYLAALSDIYAAVQQIAPAWVSGTIYTETDKVSYNGVVYARKTSGSITSNTNPASDTTNWEAKKVSELFLGNSGDQSLAGALAQSGVGGIVQTLNSSAEEVGVKVWNGSNYAVKYLADGIYVSTDSGTTYIKLSYPSVAGTLALLSDILVKSIKLNGAALTPDANGAVNIALTTDDLDYASGGGSMQLTLALDTIFSTLGGLAPLSSPAFTGTPTAPTPTTGDNSTKVATTAFVKTAIAGATPNLDYVMRVDPETGGIYYTTPDTNA